ncbi:MAG: tripartite tricarboxylate transporter substrate binding protein [Desulfocucumaceae bacterium]
MNKKSLILLVSFAAIMSLLLAGCGGKDAGKNEVKYPTKPITVIVPYGAGGTTDIHARVVASFLEKKLGQPVSVVNKVGAAGIIGYREIQHAQPDGYTLGCVVIPDVSVHKKNSGVKMNEFKYIGSFTGTIGTLTVKKDSPFKTIQQFVEYVKQNPGQVNVAISADMWKLHVIELEEAFGVKLKTIMFKSGGESINALLGGHVQANMGGFQLAVKGTDKLTTLLLTGVKDRIDALPNTPTAKELGYNIDYKLMYSFVTPKDTPDPVINKLSAAFKELGSDKEFLEKMKATGDYWSPSYGQDLEKFSSSMTELISKRFEKYGSEFE